MNIESQFLGSRARVGVQKFNMSMDEQANDRKQFDHNNVVIQSYDVI